MDKTLKSSTQAGAGCVTRRQMVGMAAGGLVAGAAASALAGGRAMAAESAAKDGASASSSAKDASAASDADTSDILPGNVTTADEPGPGTRYTTFPNVDEIGILHDASSEESVDLLIAGSGIGGLMCAMITAEQAPDAKILLVEQRNMCGGGTNYAEQSDLPAESVEWTKALQDGDVLAADSHYIKDGLLLAQKEYDQGMNSAWLFLKQALPVNGDANHPKYEGGNGSKTITNLIDRIGSEDAYKNIEIRTETRATALILADDHTVTGVQIRDADDNYTNVNVKAFYMGTGGMSNNLDLLRAYSGQDMSKLEALDQGHYGDGHLMAEQTAHGICKTIALSSMMGYVPGFSFQSILNASVSCNPTCVFVNQNGLRFTREDADHITNDDIMFLVHYSKMVESQGEVFSIVGSDLMDLFRRHGQWMYLGFYGQPEMPFDEWDPDTELAKYLGSNENVFQADTLEELAEKIGVPTDAFVTTIKQYDADCAAGTGDSVYLKPAEWMVPVGDAPYYAFKLKSFLVNTNNGIRVNNKCQVCDPAYTPIKGLYAGGIAISGFNDEIYHTGLCQSVAVFSGSKAARTIVEENLGGTVADDWYGDEIFSEQDSVLNWEDGTKQTLAAWEAAKKAAASSTSD
ncbi:FAD-binding protein [bacterium]|nr:FAD-binding protein [bacterium]